MGGGPVVTGTINCVTNGGLDAKQQSKFCITFNDNNTGKAFYNLLERELAKCSNPNVNLSKYSKVSHTPTLPIEQIFPDQFAAYKQQQRLKQGVSAKNVTFKQQQIVVGQSPNDAPMSLTHDYRAQKARLFSSASAPNVMSSGMITGASPINFAANPRKKMGRTVIEDATKKYNDHRQQQQQQQRSKQNVALPSNQYNAYIDPDNPDDIVLSVPVDDDGFGDEIEGKMNGDGNGNGYMYGIGKNYDDKHGQKGKNIAVAVNLNEDDDDAHFAQRPKVKAAVLASNKSPNPKSKRKGKGNVNGNSKVENDDLWQDSKVDMSSEALLNGNYKQNWQTFAE